MIQNEVKLITTFQHHKSPINTVCFSSIGVYFLAGSSDGIISVTTLNNQTWSSQPIKVSDRPITSTSWSPPSFFSFIDNPNINENLYFVVGSADGFISIFNLKNGSWSLGFQPIQVHSGSTNSVAWRHLPGGERFEIATCGEDGIVKLLIYEDNKWEQIDICKNLEEQPVFVKWSPCGFILSVGIGQSNIILFREISIKNWKIIESE